MEEKNFLRMGCRKKLMKLGMRFPSDFLSIDANEKEPKVPTPEEVNKMLLNAGKLFLKFLLMLLRLLMLMLNLLIPFKLSILLMLL